MNEAAVEGGSPSTDSFTCLGIILGPYRNLTTLTAASLALHPAVQVLNHAFLRLQQIEGIDFLNDPAEGVLRKFLAVAVRESAGGRRGNDGGSILHSHAFDDPSMRQQYERRFGGVLLKPAATCLVWKDSLRIQNRLMADKSVLPRVMAKLPDVRFVLPVRRPLDCAVSNVRTGKSRMLQPLSETLTDVLDAVLSTIVWVLIQRDRWPDRFFAFTEKADRKQLALDLARFLGVPADAQWIGDFQAAFDPRPTAAEKSAKAMEQEKIAAALAPWPDIRDPLLG